MEEEEEGEGGVLVQGLVVERGVEDQSIQAAAVVVVLLIYRLQLLFSMK